MWYPEFLRFFFFPPEHCRVSQTRRWQGERMFSCILQSLSRSTRQSSFVCPKKRPGSLYHSLKSLKSRWCHRIHSWCMGGLVERLLLWFGSKNPNQQRGRIEWFDSSRRFCLLFS